MKNELLTIGSFTVYGYGFMIAVGILAAWITIDFRAARQKLDRDCVFYLIRLQAPLRAVSAVRSASRYVLVLSGKLLEMKSTLCLTAQSTISGLSTIQSVDSTPISFMRSISSGRFINTYML